jgi:hypothetical protein
MQRGMMRWHVEIIRSFCCIPVHGLAVMSESFKVEVFGLC